MAATVGKWLAAAGQPLSYRLCIQAAPLLRRRAGAATSTDDDPFAVQYEAQNAAERRYSHPQQSIGPSIHSPWTHVARHQGDAETDEGVMVTAVIDGPPLCERVVSETIIIAIRRGGADAEECCQ